MRFITLFVCTNTLRHLITHVATWIDHSRVIDLLIIVVGSKIQDTRISIN